jgi:hypothetical protein
MTRATPVLLSVALVALTAIPTVRALGSTVHSRPPGIAPSAWVPITDNLGVVVEPQIRQLSASARDRQFPVAGGYFVIERDGSWLRLDSLSQQPMSRRPTTAASSWLSFNRNLAFVIKQELPGQPMRGQEPTPSALGYFVVKRNAHWLRLQPIAQNALFRGPLGSRTKSDWVPVSNSLRFVIEQKMPQRYVSGQLPSVLGYFIGKRGGHWLRLGSIV